MTAAQLAELRGSLKPMWRARFSTTSDRSAGSKDAGPDAGCPAKVVLVAHDGMHALRAPVCYSSFQNLTTTSFGYRSPMPTKIDRVRCCNDFAEVSNFGTVRK